MSDRAKSVGVSASRMTLQGVLLRLLGALIPLVLGVAGCAHGVRANGEASRVPLGRWEAEVPEFRARVPAETPYLYGTLEPVDVRRLSESIDATLTVDQRALERSEDPSDRRIARLVRLYNDFLGEIDAETPRERFETLGFGPEAAFGCYGLGNLPVCRLTIREREAFFNFLMERERAAGIEAEARELEGRPYHVFRLSQRRVAWAAVTDREFIFGAAPAGAVEAYVARGLGAESPERSMAETGRFEGLAKRYGFGKVGGGFVDFERLARMRWPTSEQTEAEGSVGREAAVCASEWRRVGRAAGLLVLGVRSLEKDAVDIAVALESDAAAVAALRRAATAIPAYDDAVARQGVVSLGVGLDIGQLLEAAAAWGSMSLFECESLAWLNRWATGIGERARRVPEFMGAVRGLQAMAVSFSATREPRQLNDAGVVVLARTTQRKRLLEKFMTFVPGWEGAAVPAEGRVVAMRPPVESPFFDPFFLGSTGNRVGLATESGFRGELKDLLAAGADEGGRGAEEDEPPSRTPLMSVQFGERFPELVSWLTGGRLGGDVDGKQGGSGETGAAGAGREDGGAPPSSGGGRRLVDERPFSFEFGTPRVGDIGYIELMRSERGLLLEIRSEGRDVADRRGSE